MVAREHEAPHLRDRHVTPDISPILEGTVRTAMPLALAATGEVACERAGVINLGLEGSMIAGALAGAMTAPSAGIAAGFAAAAAAGATVAMVFALFAVIMRSDQIITGTAITMLALGVTGTLYRWRYGATGTALTVPTSPPLRIPFLAGIPVIGPALFDQPPITYVAYLLIPVVWWWLYRTHAGLALRATGESPEAARAAGISPRRIRFAATLVSGTMGGLAGGALVLAQAGTFAEGMSAGRGFIAVAIVVLGRWHPAGVALAALVFGGASALQYSLQAAGTRLPYQIFLATPYVLTLVALALARGRTRAPESLARADV